MVYVMREQMTVMTVKDLIIALEKMPPGVTPRLDTNREYEHFHVYEVYRDKEGVVILKGY